MLCREASRKVSFSKSSNHSRLLYVSCVLHSPPGTSKACLIRTVCSTAWHIVFCSDWYSPAFLQRRSLNVVQSHRRAHADGIVTAAGERGCGSSLGGGDCLVYMRRASHKYLCAPVVFFRSSLRLWSVLLEVDIC